MREQGAGFREAGEDCPTVPPTSPRWRLPQSPISASSAGRVPRLFSGYRVVRTAEDPTESRVPEMSRISVGCVVADRWGVPVGTRGGRAPLEPRPWLSQASRSFDARGGRAGATHYVAARADNGDCSSLSGGTSCSSNFLLWREEARVPPELAAAVPARLRASASSWPERWRQGPAEPARWVAAPAPAASRRMRARRGRAGGRSLGGATPASQGLLGRCGEAGQGAAPHIPDTADLPFSAPLQSRLGLFTFLSSVPGTRSET